MIGEAVEDRDDDRIVADTGQDRRQSRFQGIILDADEDDVLDACRGGIVRDGRMGRVVAEEVAVDDEALCLERFFALPPGNECYVIIIGTEDGRDISPTPPMPVIMIFIVSTPLSIIKYTLLSHRAG